MSYRLTDELLQRGHDRRVWLDLDERVLRHPEDEEVAFVGVELRDGCLVVVGLDELLGNLSIESCM